MRFSRRLFVVSLLAVPLALLVLPLALLVLLPLAPRIVATGPS